VRQRGFTFVEVLSACTIAGVLASVALPAWQGSVTRSRRADAVNTLARVQAAQERHRATHGRYAADLAALQLGAQSEQGLYEIAVEPTGADAYRASARAVGAQATDNECPRLLLDVNGGFAQAGPSARCWNR
jgi:type IV pilus assembly protein PilE